jgi:hypothetical protein
MGSERWLVSKEDVELNVQRLDGLEERTKIGKEKVLCAAFLGFEKRYPTRRYLH